MARKLINSFLIIFIFLIFLITFTSSLPLNDVCVDDINKRQTPDPGYVFYGNFDASFYPYADANEITFIYGDVTLSRLYDNSTRIYGQANTGILDTNPAFYEMWIVPYPICPPYDPRFDLTPYVTFNMDNHLGSASFECDVNMFSFEETYHKWLIIRHYGYTIGAAYIKYPTEV